MEEMLENEHMVWLSRLAQRDDKAFRVLFTRFYSCFVSFAMKYVGVKDVAEDIVQDAFYRFFCHPREFSSEADLKSYFYTVIHNGCIDLLRRNKYDREYMKNLREEDFVFVENVFEEEVWQVLREMVKKLPERTKEVYDLVLDGYENAEICRITGMSMDAVKSHKKRGKIFLQKLEIKTK